MSSKIVKVVLAGCLLLSVGWSISTGVGKKTLRVYNWGEYIDKTTRKFDFFASSKDYKTLLEGIKN